MVRVVPNLAAAQSSIRHEATGNEKGMNGEINIHDMIAWLDDVPSQYFESGQ